MSPLDFLSVDSSPILILAVLSGMAIGAAVAWAMRLRMSNAFKNPLGMAGYYGGGLLLGGLLLGGCVMLGSGTNTGLAPTRTPTPTRPVPTNTAAPVRPSGTPQSARPIETPTPTPEPESIVWPETFSLVLVFDTDTVCGNGGFEFDYSVALTGDSMTLVQIINGITLTGPFDPTTGEFEVEVGGLPGTEVFTGVLALDDQTVLMAGTYTYIDGSASTCDGLWPFSGDYTP